MRMLLTFILFVFPFWVFGQEAPLPTMPTIPEVPTLSAIADLVMYMIKNWKALGTLGAVSAILSLLIGILRGPWLDGWFAKLGQGWKRAIILILGQVLGIIIMLVEGSVWYVAIIQGLFTSGGAILIYETLKPLLGKKKE